MIIQRALKTDTFRERESILKTTPKTSGDKTTLKTSGDKTTLKTSGEAFLEGTLETSGKVLHKNVTIESGGVPHKTTLETSVKDLTTVIFKALDNHSF
jgi:hypothetical protein